MSAPVGGAPPADALAQAHAAAAQTAAIRRVRGVRAVLSTSPARPHAGLVTRALALALDAAIINGIAALVGLTIGLALSLLHLPSQVDAVIAAISGAVWVIWSIAYFTVFWSTTGQTPGARVMAIRVIDGRGRGPIKPLRAIVRFAGLILAALPLLAGFLIMLWDDRRRCLQDRLAHTVVIYVSSGAPPPGAPPGVAPLLPTPPR
jgi:uncharacterized RDD family membrane protein YckC